MSANKQPATLVEKVAADIQSHIESRVFSVGERLPSTHELCRNYKVSTITIRAALKELMGLGLIESRPRSGFYVKSHVADEESASDARLLALLLPTGDNPFFQAIWKGAEEACRARGYHLAVAVCEDDAELQEKQIAEFASRATGLLITPVIGSANYSAYSGLMEKKIPFVFIDRHLEKLAAPVVSTDNELGGYLATRHLIEAGQKRIFVLGAELHEGLQERVKGYRRALKEFGIAFDPSLVRSLRVARENLQQHEAAGYVLTRELLRSFSPQTPFGIFALNDCMALGSYVALGEAGLKIPGDVAVIGFDDNYARFGQPPLSSVHQDASALGATATGVLLEALNADKSRGVASVCLKPELVIRNSSDPRSDFSLASHLENHLQYATNEMRVAPTEAAFR